MKSDKQYLCKNCGSVQKKWVGQCPDCNEWNSLQEVAAATSTAVGGKAKGGRFTHYAGSKGTGVKALDSIESSAIARQSTGEKELDRVLGGGLVSGGVILIGGDPGIGKSTILIQTLAKLEHMASLYVSGEESMEQISLRAKRLQLPTHHLRLLTETQVELIIEQAQIEQPQLMVIDSIQTIYTDEVSSAPGSVSQVREATARLTRYAKQTNTTLFIAGHVTKEGSLAGPRILEHMVDTVLYFEGDPGSRYRMLRAVKNRFGAANELGLFAMSELGLKGVSNPSAIFLSQHDQDVSGSITLVSREGSRPLLLELQVLVDESQGSHPKRLVIGLEQNRIAMLLAVLHRHAGVAMMDQDVFVNIVGGVKISETAADLPILLAALSSLRNKPIAQGLVAFGEVGLAGEIRPVPNGEERLYEAQKHGFKRAIVPKANAPKTTGKGGKALGIEIRAVSRLEEALDALFED